MSGRMNIRHLTPMVLAATLGWLAGSLVLVSAPTLAAKPEAPGAPAVQSPVGAAKVMVRGVLSPLEEGHPGTYEFLYKKGSGSCEGEGVAPESPGMMLGFKAEEVSQELKGLVAHTQYSVCLRAETEGGMTVGPAVAFTTAPVLEVPETKPATVTGATEVTLYGVLDPGKAGEASGYEFLYKAGTECQGGEAAGGSVTVLAGESTPVSSGVGGLAAHTQYTVCLLARNEAGETALGAPVTFTTSIAPPVVESESFSAVHADSALVNAQVNDGNEESSYYYRYGSKGEFEGGKPKATSPQVLAASSGAVAAPAELIELQAGGEYRFQVVVTNNAGETSEGAEEAFKTLAGEMTGLPDGRVFEMVTPPENQDADVYVPYAYTGGELNSGEGGIDTKLPFLAAAKGGAVVYAGDATTGGAGSTGNGVGDQYLATRAAGGGWTQAILQPLGNKSAFYQAFSSDLSVGILESGGVAEAPLAEGVPGEGYKVLYAHTMGKAGYRPLFTTTPRLSAGEFRTYGVPLIFSGVSGEVAYAGASANLEDLLFEANDALVPGAEEAGEKKNNLYVTAGGRLSLVNVLPDGSSKANATFGARAFQEEQSNPPDFSHVISADGSKIFWTDINTGMVYVRENATSADASTIPISAGSARFWTATTDGRYVFYSEGPAGEQQLLRFNFDKFEESIKNGVVEAQALDEAREVLAGEGAGVEGILGTSESGGFIYFVATGDLVGSEQNSQGNSPIPGEDNLYALHEGETRGTRFITTLSGEDGKKNMGALSKGSIEFGDWQPGFGNRTAEVTPGGESLVFMSNHQDIEGYSPMLNGEPLQEVYVYEYGANRLVCASCDPAHESSLVNSQSERGMGGFLPPSWSATHLSDWMPENGSRVFFDSVEPLVPADTNGKPDVYEWERDETGSCRESKGCIYLLSGGTGSSASYLAGASEDGNEVFIVSRSQLSPEDHNEAYNLFDARVEGAQPVAAPACTGTGCQGVPATAPTFATPASVTFTGVGNFPPPVETKPASKPKPKAKLLTRAQKLAKSLKGCRKKPKGAKRTACEKQARSKYGKPAKRSSAKGRR